MGVGPLFTHTPVGLEVLTELLARLDLLAEPIPMSGGHVTRARLAGDDTHHAVVRAVAGVGTGRAQAPGLVALHVAHRQGTAAHGSGLGLVAREIADRRRDIEGIGHRAYFPI